MSATKAATLQKLPARMTLAVISPKKRSTRLSQEEEGNEVDVKTGVMFEPGFHLGVLVGGIVIANDVKLEFGSRLPIDLAQEGQPLLMTMARGGMSEYLAGQIVQGSKEGYRSMAIVVVGLGANVSLAQRQARLGAFESLTLALFITAEHQGPIGRIEIEAHHVPEHRWAARPRVTLVPRRSPAASTPPPNRRAKLARDQVHHGRTRAPHQGLQPGCYGNPLF
jgi:hypothetical protein